MCWRFRRRCRADGGFSGYGQLEEEPSSTTRLTLDPDLSAVGFHDSPGDRQSQAGAKSFGSLRARLDLSNLTNTKYAQYGFTLTDFSTGQPAPFYYPGARFAARFGIDWRN